MTRTIDPAERAARQTGYSAQDWRDAKEILGSHWDYAWETVAHLAVRSSMKPAQVARILVGGEGYPGVL